MESEPASFVAPSHIPSRQSASTSLHYGYSTPSPVRPGLSASIHAPSPQRRGLNASIHASISPSPSEDDLCDIIYATPTPPRPILSTNTHPPSLPRPDLSASIHAPCTPPKTGLNASIHAPSGDKPMEPIPIPVIDLSPDRRVRRVIDPRRECNLIVLVDCGTVLPLSP